MTYFDQLFVTSTSDAMRDEEYDLFIRGEANTLTSLHSSPSVMRDMKTWS